MGADPGWNFGILAGGMFLSVLNSQNFELGLCKNLAGTAGLCAAAQICQTVASCTVCVINREQDG